MSNPMREWHIGNKGPTAWAARDCVTRNCGDGRQHKHLNGHPRVENEVYSVTARQAPGARSQA